MNVFKRGLCFFIVLIFALSLQVATFAGSGDVSVQFYGQNTSDYTWSTLIYSMLNLGSTVNVNSAINADKLSALDSTVELGLQIKDESLTVGQSSTISVDINNIVIKATGYQDVSIDKLAYNTTLSATSASWGITGNALDIDLSEYLSGANHIKAITNISAEVNLKSYSKPENSSGSGDEVIIAPPTEPMVMSDKTGFEVVEDMKIGWNLGNSLDCNNKTYTTPEAHETYWSNPVTTKAMVDTVKAAGFNTIRIPVSWGEKMDSNYIVDKAWMDRVEQVVNYGLSNDMYVILNVHHDNDWIVPKAENKEYTKTKLTALWTQIAQRFSYYDEHLIFEVLNEPRLVGDATEWTGGTSEARSIINEYNQTAIDAIRQTGGNNLKRFVMAPPHAASMSALNGYKVPDDEYVIVSVHNYLPYEFAMNGYGTATWGSDSDKTSLRAEFQTLYNAFIANGVPVVIGEFGATNKNNNDARAEWAKYYVSTAREYGIACVLWDNNKADSGSEMFGMLNRNTLNWYFPSVVNALVEGAQTAVIYQPGEGGGSTGSATDIFSGIATSSNWGQAVEIPISSISGMVAGDKLAVEYSSTTAPEMIMQMYEPAKWIKIDPDSAANGIAYYSYESIIQKIGGGIGTFDVSYIGDKGTSLTVTRVYVVGNTILGDINEDGNIDVYDATLVAKYSIGATTFTDKMLTIADVNNDGTVNIVDATIIAKLAIGA